MPQDETGLGESWTMVDDDATGESVPPSPSKLLPSLAERTMETLSRLPSSPSVKGRNASSFYETASHQSDESGGRSTGSRPGSASGLDESVSTFRSQIATFNNPLSPVEDSPLRNRRSIQSFQTPSAKTPSLRQPRTSMYGMPPPSTISVPRTRSPSPEKYAPEILVPKPASKTLVPRPPSKRPPVNGLLKKPSAPALKKTATAETPKKASLVSRGSSVASYEGTNASSLSVASASTGMTSDSTEPGLAYKKSSAALRDQIAKARAAKRTPAQPVSAVNSMSAAEEPALVPSDASFGYGLSNDPFNQHRDDKSQAKILDTRLATARTSGRLNIAAMGLREIPAAVFNMYNLESIGQSGGAWAESVDLSRFVAADNELEMITDSVFPDVDPHELAEDEDGQCNIFAGLETLDLHGNILVTLPMGLRRLSLLTSLNLVRAWQIPSQPCSLLTFCSL